MTGVKPGQTPSLKMAETDAIWALCTMQNRLFAGGVNKLVFHGSTYKFSDTENTYFPVTQTWPGYSAMSALSYGNEWMIRPHVGECGYYDRCAGTVSDGASAGQGDIDLAVYRSLYGKGNVRPK